MAELTQEQIDQLQELLKQSRAPEPTAVQNTPQNTSFNIKLGGQNYVARDADEAQRLIDQYDAQRGQELEAERIRATALEQQQQRLQEMPQRQVSGVDDGFDKEEYARLFLNDPRKAQQYLVAHDPAQLQFFGGIVNQMNAMKQELAASQFLLQHKDDYIPTPESYKAIESIVTQYNLPWDINGMNIAFAVSKQMGLIKTPDADVQQESNEEPVYQEPVMAAPRLSSRRSSQNQAALEQAQIMDEFEKLTPDAMKKYLESIK